MVVEWLNIMFIPKFEPDRQDKYSPVWKWEIFDNCGVYSVLNHDVTVKYYLAERKYKFGIRFMFDLFRAKLRAHKTSLLAIEIIERIKEQLQAELRSSNFKI